MAVTPEAAYRLFVLLLDRDAQPAAREVPPSLAGEALGSEAWLVALGARLHQLQLVATDRFRGVDVAVLRDAGPQPLCAYRAGDQWWLVRNKDRWREWFALVDHLVLSGFVTELGSSSVTLRLDLARLVRRRQLLYPPVPTCGSELSAGDRVALELRPELHELVTFRHLSTAVILEERGAVQELDLGRTMAHLEGLRVRAVVSSSPGPSLARWRALRACWGVLPSQQQPLLCRLPRALAP